MTPDKIADLVPEDVADTYLVINEMGLWHRRQPGGQQFDQETPVQVVLDFIRDQPRISRYDFQSFLDYLQDAIMEQVDSLRELASEEMVDDFYDAGGPTGKVEDDAPYDWIDSEMTGICDLLAGVVPVLRRSQAQARSGSHAKALLDRHLERLTNSVRDIQDKAPEDAVDVLDLMHMVVGGIIQACDTIKDQVFPLLWRR